jgi:GrpB-like predicted nucleotidyltransferase (UPF0157 family)
VTGTLQVVPYDERWPARFEELRSRLENALGALSARIEHVGSTAVPGLAAKPKIDVDIVVRSREELPAAIARLAEIGFGHQGDLGIPGREVFRGPDGGDTYHVYVCVDGAQPLREHLAFRDYLRAHPETAEEYGRLKRDLAARLRSDRDAYTRAKTTFVERVLALAAAEAE